MKNERSERFAVRKINLRNFEQLPALGAAY